MLFAILLLFAFWKQTKNINLIVSNQSFDIPLVDVSVSIDGVIYLKKDLPVKNQHYYEKFPISLSSGYHTIEINGNKGQTVLMDKFEVCADKNMVIGVCFFYNKDCGYENGPVIELGIFYLNNKDTTRMNSKENINIY
jgi:hypothetical protein